MPKQSNVRQVRRQGPYDYPALSHLMPSNVPRPQYWTMPSPPQGPPMPLLPISNNALNNNLQLTIPSHYPVHPAQEPIPPPTPQSPTKDRLGRHQAGAWTTGSDQLLLSLRGRGLNWSEIQREFFDNKSANACRKRYERIMAKQKGSHEWSEERIARLSEGYREMRDRIWLPLARYVGDGDNWEAVERKVSLTTCS